MKKISIYIILATLALTSCNKWLEEDMKSKTDGTMYSDADYLSRTNYLYRHGVTQDLASAGSGYCGPRISVDGMLTGYFTNSYEGQEIHCKYAGELTREQHTSDCSARMSEGAWEGCYRAINVANQLINDKGTPSVYLGEAKFFRAYNYFYLAKKFCEVPLCLTYTSSVESENLTLGQSVQDSVFAQVKRDLKDAVELLPDGITFAQNEHRITASIAKMLLADVSMYTADYATAAKCARDVIGTPGLALLTNDNLTTGSYINKLRTTDDNSEVVYALEFNEAQTPSGSWPTYSFNSSATAVFDKYSIFERVYGVANGFLNIYDTTDLRIQEQQFFVWSYKNTVNGKVWKASDYKSPGSFYYFDRKAMEETGHGTHDCNMYRLAEAYLDAAEAIAQTEGVTAEAQDYLNAIRKRAGLADVTTTDKNAFIEACWTERLREFPLEFKIWDDCVRTGKFPVINKDHTVTYVALSSATNARGASFSGKSLYWPIGLLQLQRNPNLHQIDGYASK